mgnify:CR=1 FL=1
MLENGALGDPKWYQNNPKWSPWGALGHPWEGLGASWGQLGLDIEFLVDFGPLFDSFLEPKWGQKLTQTMPKPEVKNSTEIKYNFHEKS